MFQLVIILRVIKSSINNIGGVDDMSLEESRNESRVTYLFSCGLFWTGVYVICSTSWFETALAECCLWQNV